MQYWEQGQFHISLPSSVIAPLKSEPMLSRSEYIHSHKMYSLFTINVVMLVSFSFGLYSKNKTIICALQTLTMVAETPKGKQELQSILPQVLVGGCTCNIYTHSLFSF